MKNSLGSTIFSFHTDVTNWQFFENRFSKMKYLERKILSNDGYGLDEIIHRKEYEGWYNNFLIKYVLDMKVSNFGRQKKNTVFHDFVDEVVEKGYYDKRWKLLKY